MDQRVEDEDAEDQQRREQQEVRESALLPLRAGVDDAIVDDRGHVTRRSGCRRWDRTRAALPGRAIRCTTSLGGRDVGLRALADDDELAVGEAARDVALVPERFDDRDGGGDSPLVARAAGLRAARRAPRSPSRAASTACASCGGERRPPAGDLHDEAVADPRDASVDGVHRRAADEARRRRGSRDARRRPAADRSAGARPRRAPRSGGPSSSLRPDRG